MKKLLEKDRLGFENYMQNLNCIQPKTYNMILKSGALKDIESARVKSNKIEKL